MTVSEVIRSVSPSIARSRSLPPWPPDAFAIAAVLLDRTDAYRWIINRRTILENRGYLARVKRLARQWRKATIDERPPPGQVEAWWRDAVGAYRRRADAIPEDDRVWKSLLGVLAVADSASAGSGIPTVEGEPDLFQSMALKTLDFNGGASLCREVPVDRFLVLPKQHTPQSGIHLRSLSHNLALCRPGGAIPNWCYIDERSWMSQKKGTGKHPKRGLWKAQSLNLLLLPWPEEVRPSDFEPARGPFRKKYRYFQYRPSDGRNGYGKAEVEPVLKRARATVGSVDGIVFPELSLARDDCKALCADTGTMIIGGEGEIVPEEAVGFGTNRAVVAYPLKEGQVVAYLGQDKAHRWKVDGSQIRQYGLGGRLDPGKSWWECVRIPRRRLPFWSVNAGLCFCVLICEDLARQEPIADLVRSVGPNLVIALLMDGPQLNHRWPARYATVLADDPGCSVLTLTSLGMARLCRPPGKDESRVIGLWKEAGGEAVPIVLPKDFQGVVISLNMESREELSADGRGEEFLATTIRLGGVHPV